MDNHIPVNAEYIVDGLERYKRRLGRRYDKEREPRYKEHLRTLYNECEDAIAHMCVAFRVKRKEKAYKIGG
jgi:hypothetical protein